jgi:EAL domain-containing protein (putative c-di-GMP-specific phosphodiesterase class I)
VVAEGVETRTQLDALRALGCEYAQGYYFSRPVKPEEIEQKLLGSAAGWESAVEEESAAPV